MLDYYYPMDPLSLTASILAVLGAGSTLMKSLDRALQLKRAPDTLLQLNNEVADLQILVRAVDEIWRQDGASITVAQQEVVSKALDRARVAVLELEKLIAYILTRETDGGPTVYRLAWAYAHGRIKRTKDKLRTARNDLNSVWAAMNQRFEASALTKLRLSLML